MDDPILRHKNIMSPGKIAHNLKHGWGPPAGAGAGTIAAWLGSLFLGPK